VIDCGGKCLAPGIVDWGVKIGEPGERHRESFRSAGLAAAAGGVTTIIARPDTQPAIDTPEVLEFVTRRAAESSPGPHPPHGGADQGPRGPRDDRDRLPAAMPGPLPSPMSSHVSTEDQGAGPRDDLCAQPGRAGRRPPAGPGPVRGAAATQGKFASLRGCRRSRRWPNGWGWSVTWRWSR
jgi:dihydroorotase